jgi:hypothetical protein
MVAMFFSETSKWKYSNKIIPTFPLSSLPPNRYPTESTEATVVTRAQDLQRTLEPQGTLDLRMQQVIQDALEQQVQQLQQVQRLLNDYWNHR